MWAVLMGVLLILLFAGVLYLSSRIGRFSFFQKLARGKKRLAMFFGFLVTAVFTAVIWFLWGSMNAIVCVLHLLVFWLISDGIFSLIKKRRGKIFFRYYAGAVAIVFTICYLGTGWYLANHVWGKNYQIQTDKEVGNLKVAVFSDSHVGTTFHGKGFAEHMKTIENLINITPDNRIYGYEKRDNTNFIVTSGISDWAIKFKTGCKSEYLMVEINQTK